MFNQLREALSLSEDLQCSKNELLKLGTHFVFCVILFDDFIKFYLMNIHFFIAIKNLKYSFEDNINEVDYIKNLLLANENDNLKKLLLEKEIASQQIANENVILRKLLLEKVTESLQLANENDILKKFLIEKEIS